TGFRRFQRLLKLRIQVLIFFALSCNNIIEEASRLFREACFKDADGNRITSHNPSPVYNNEFTTEPTDEYKYGFIWLATYPRPTLIRYQLPQKAPGD
ncbi:hypothetical protein, partial [Endozoicomonas sp. ONNA2]|uniref:hypothetical protein n=1 Tax=Endozoicomonas sp. ONNA2 TaxID=2828741 RepID=UPI0021496AE5